MTIKFTLSSSLKEVQYFIRENGKTKTNILKVSDIDIVDVCYKTITAQFPNAIDALNGSIYFTNNFKVVEQFIKCNINPEDGMLILYNNEFVIKHQSFCPMKKKCPMFNVVCVFNPKI